MSDDISFRVNPDELDVLRRQLDDVVAGMNAAGNSCTGYQAADLGPTAAVWNSLERFHGDWSDGVAKIKQNVAGLAARLSEAARAYRELDGRIAGQESVGGT
jgi:Excreted virulence factor EspC, type VII ESX diderm